MKTCLMPDYYQSFSCKMGACRFSCCEGWPVSITQAEYYKLLSLKCSKKLRAEIDCSLKILPDATPERFASIEHRYDGNCHMRLEDGRCALHASLGEDSLPMVCRRYPRNQTDSQCSCTNSCERTIEILIHHNGSLKFIAPENYEYTKEQKMRLFFISLLQNRDMTIPGRFYALGLAMQELDKEIKQNIPFDKQEVLNLIANKRPSISSKDIMDNLSIGLGIITNLIDTYDNKSNALKEYGEEVLKQAHSTEDIRDSYLESKTIFETQFPFWESAFENMIVNHMFFSDFPFADNGKTLEEEYGSLCALYGMMRVLSLGWAVNHPKEEHFVDMFARIFRFVDHTSFHSNTGFLLKKNNINTLEQFFTLANI